MQSVTYNINQRIENALVKLRKQKHQAGFPFMISDFSFLPENQAFMEYPDGKVELVQFTKEQETFTLIRVLDSKEVSDFRVKYQLN